MKLQQKDLLGLLLAILEQHTVGRGVFNTNLARNISLFFFYATYIAFPGDDSSAQALQHLVFDLHFPKLSLSILSKPCGAALALSIVRNVHNAIATLQGGAKLVLEAKIDYEME